MKRGPSVRRPASVLVVERDAELRRYLVRALTALETPPPRIHEAEDVAAANRVLEQRGVELVIAALDGPDGGGRLCKALRVGDAGQVPVLLVATGVSSALDAREADSLGATTLLTGSLSGTRLRTTVRRILDL